ncbi:MAG: permease-like cell division protein FtsX [Dermatophilus congolensis]|nr:permease-like cell division protein FtsX [Dermatophilus congolensis]
MRPTFLAREVGTGLRRNSSMFASIVIVTMVSLVFLGVGLLAGRQVESAKGFWYDKIEVSIFLCTKTSSEPNCGGAAATPQQQGAVEELLRSYDETIASHVYESQDEAYARFKEQFADNPTFAETPKDAIPAAYRVKLVNPEDYKLVHDAFAGMPGVAAVKDIREVLDPLIRVLDLLKVGAWALAGVMLVAMVLLVSTTIRQVAWTRRRETSIKRMVGASSSALQLPFLVETLVATTVGAGLAIAGLWAGVRFGISQLADRFSDFAWISGSDVLAIAPVLLLVSVVLTLVVSLLSVARHVRV